MQNSIQHKNTLVSYEVIIKNNSNHFILFMHGFGCDSSIWQSIQENIKTSYNQILINFPPFGNSGSLLCDWTLKDYTEIVENILIKENCQKVDIICHSFGARVAIELSIKNQQINKMIFIAAAGIRENKLKTSYKITAYKLKKFFSKLKVYNKEKLKRYGSEEYNSLSPIMKKTFSNIVSYDQTKRLKLIKNQTLLLWAEDDQTTTIKSAKKMNRLIKNSELFTFKNGGHFVFIPYYQNIANAIDLFLKE